MITIFTPTFNRSNFLINAYKALCEQTCQDFVWLIIDDGSTDNTASLIKTWQREGKINIEYHYQLNSGKMSAHNKAVNLTTTELFTCIDSDDYLIPDAVNMIQNVWEQVKKTYLTELPAGIVAYRGIDSKQTMHGERFPDLKLSTLGNLYHCGFFGETTLIFRVDVLKKYPFPIISGEKFIPEAVVYDKIDMEYQLYVLPKVLTICEYQPSGLTNSIKQLKLDNPNGYLLYYQIKIKITSFSILRYKYIAHAICFTWYLNKNLFEQIPARTWEIIGAIPAAFLLRIFKRL